MRSRLVFVTAVVAAALWTAAASAQDQAHSDSDKHGAGALGHSEATEVRNPMSATPQSIADGKKVYDARCASCHGVAGKGDGKLVGSMKLPRPSDFTDETWQHGSTDGEIYTLIRTGSKGTAMRAFASSLKTEDIWNVVNYLKTLGPTPPPSR
jgi:mono/diheme cytochrome c family protein